MFAESMLIFRQNVICLEMTEDVTVQYMFHDLTTYTVFEIRLLNLLARKLKNWSIYIYIDSISIEKIWQKSLVRINFHWLWATGPLLKSMTANRGQGYRTIV